LFGEHDTKEDVYQVGKNDKKDKFEDVILVSFVGMYSKTEN